MQKDYSPDPDRLEFYMDFIRLRDINPLHHLMDSLIKDGRFYSDFLYDE